MCILIVVELNVLRALLCSIINVHNHCAVGCRPNQCNEIVLWRVVYTNAFETRDDYNHAKSERCCCFFSFSFSSFCLIELVTHWYDWFWDRRRFHGIWFFFSLSWSTKICLEQQKRLFSRNFIFFVHREFCSSEFMCFFSDSVVLLLFCVEFIAIRLRKSRSKYSHNGWKSRADDDTYQASILFIYSNYRNIDSKIQYVPSYQWRINQTIKQQKKEKIHPHFAQR